MEVLTHKLNCGLCFSQPIRRFVIHYIAVVGDYTTNSRTTLLSVLPCTDLSKKKLQYFSKRKNNSATPNPFSDIFNMTNHTGIRIVKLAWYSPSGIYRICFYGSEHGFVIQFYVYLTFLDRQGPSDPSETLKLPHRLFLHDKCFFLYSFCSIMGQFELVNHKFADYNMVHVYLCSFQITHRIKQRTMCQRTNCHDTINHSGYILTAWTASVIIIIISRW